MQYPNGVGNIGSPFVSPFVAVHRCLCGKGWLVWVGGKKDSAAGREFV